MKKLFSVLMFIVLVNEMNAQNRNTVFYDSVGKVTSYESFWSQVWTGRYKAVYNRSLNSRTMVSMSADEYQVELAKTKKRISNSFRLGETFPEFSVTDIRGITINNDSLKGKVVVLNFWFIGCTPCEVERPLLNMLATKYKESEVVFISFARNDKDQLELFLNDHPIDCRVIPTEKDFVKSTFKVNGYPVNTVLSPDGKYFFNSMASGVGIQDILKEAIDAALALKKQ